MTFEEFLLRIILVGLTFIYFVLQVIFNRRFPVEETVASVPLRREIVFSLLYILWPVAIILFEFRSFANFDLPDTVQYLGVFFYVLGIALFAWANITLGRNLSVDLQIRKGHVLVERGPYRSVRHPIYAAWLVCGLGIALLSGNWLITILYFLPVIARILIRLEPEEKMLGEHFGSKFNTYQRKTGALLPKRKTGR